MSKIELIRQNLHRSRYKSQASTQITLDDDFIVPDAMDDMEKIIVNSGDVILDSVRNQTERVMIRGKLAFQVLYRRRFTDIGRKHCDRGADERAGTGGKGRDRSQLGAGRSKY